MTSGPNHKLRSSGDIWMEKVSDVSMQSSKGPNQDLKVDSEVDAVTFEDSEDLVRSLAAAFWSFTENYNNHM